MDTEKRNDEIDLIEVTQKAGKALEKATVGLFQLIGSMFVYLFKFTIKALHFSIRYSYIIFGLAILGFFSGLYIAKTTAPYYRTSATIQSNTIPNANLINYINRIHELLANNDSISLAAQLNMDVSDAAQIYDLQAFWLIDINKDGIADEVDYQNEFMPDTVSNAVRITDRFHVQLLTYDPTILNQVQQSLEDYLLTYPRLQQISDVKKRNLEKEISRIDTEISILDSLKTYEYFVKEKELREYDKSTVKLGQLLLASPEQAIQPTRLLHENILKLYNDNLANYRALELETEPFIFLSKFVEVTNPVNVNKEEHTSVKFGILGLFLGVILSLLLKFRKEVFVFIKES
ncbi:MAG: hypothetical protein J7K39_10085 [Bacteroidales bacterium]|nr:hypothetical protein [Bacteroidales bacterium]